MKENLCCICHKPFAPDLLTEYDENLFCPSCLEEQTILCRDCGERIYRSENEGTAEHPLCSSCYDDDYTHCERCGRMIHNNNAHYFDDEDYPYCRECYNNMSEQSIHQYGYKPDPVFYGEGKRYFGVELEIDGAGEDDDAADEILSVGNCEHSHIYCKHDGSLNEGFEIVTHPMTLDYHMESMPWRGITDKAREMDYTSHQAETCGLHIHVNRDSLGSDRESQDAAIARILYFVERNWNELLIFSRRTQSQLESWARRYGYKDQPKEMLEHAKNGCAGRYMCVNLTNYSTIEFRIFRGTLKLNTIIATLQMVNRICDVAVLLSDERMKNLSWSRFVEKINEPELIKYLKERRIYVNDSVICEEEI